MKNKIIGLIVCMLLISSSVLTLSGSTVTETISKPLQKERPIFVGGSGPGNFSKIQDAIDNASEGDTIFVFNYSSPYCENLKVTKSINLVGEDHNTTVIDGGNYGDVIFIPAYANRVNISGFTIQKSGNGNNDSGIDVRSNNNNIEQNIIINNRLGIYFVYHNIDNNKVLNNTIKSNRVYGVHADPYPTGYRCKNLTIIGNEITTNHYAGIWIASCTYSHISDNVLCDNGEGLDMQWHSNNSLISNNIITDNQYYGFWLVYTYRCTVRNNYFADNGWEELCIYQHEAAPEPSNHSVYHNEIMEGCWDDGSSDWDNGYPSCGNYWDDYAYGDYYRGPNQDIPGPDGIGDLPKKITGGSNKDRYPLMYKWGENPPVACYTHKVVNYTIDLDGSISLDRDGTIVSYDWDFGDNNSGSGMKVNHTYSKSGRYKVELNVTDNDGKQGNWSLVFPVPNQLPYAPKNPNPSDGVTDVDVNADLSWNCSDPDEDPLTYTVYFKADDPTPDILVSENQTLTSFDPGKMDYTSHYYWRIVAWDVWGGATSGPIWDFTTEPNVPPYAPSNPDPSEGAVNVSVNADLSWNCSDPDSDPLTFNVYFEEDDSTPDVLISENQTLTSFDPGRMNHTTCYYWQVVAFDNSNASTSGPVWNFTTRGNVPPYAPYNPDPPEGATDVDIYADLSWDCGDPDGDNLTYDVYFEANDSTPDVLVSNNQSKKWYNPGKMDYTTHYYWQIVAWDNYNHSTSGSVWDFTTGSIPNDPPYEPSDPVPAHRSTNVDIDANLSWTGGDPNSGDTVVYDVFLEAWDSTPDIQVADDINETMFNPGLLENDTKYYWRVIAKDNHGARTLGAYWCFTTGSARKPDLSCKGSLSWIDVEPGATVEGSFTIENIGESKSLLDWDIINWPKWGTWTFIPLNGTDLIPKDGKVIVNVSVVAPDKKNKKFTGEVKIVNREHSIDFCTIDVSLATPKNNLYIFNVLLFNWLFERFPNIFPMLRYLIGVLEYKGE